MRYYTIAVLLSITIKHRKINKHLHKTKNKEFSYYVFGGKKHVSKHLKMIRHRPYYEGA